MSDTVLPSHEAILRRCAAAAPKPWYPRVFAQSSGVPRDSLDVPLNELRIAGLVRLTDWEKGVGQGYRLTEQGEEVLRNPMDLAQLRAGRAPKADAPEPAEAPEQPERARPTTYERGEAARTAYYKPEPPRVMPVILLVNLLAFALSFIFAVRANVPIGYFISEGNPTIVHELGGLSSRDLIAGEWWRLIANAFLHFGLLHLAVNMFSLYVLGIIESLWGPARFLTIYLVSAFVGSCAVVGFDPGPPDKDIILAGASGAIWGLMMSLAAWLVVNRRHLPPEEVGPWMSRLGVLILINVGVSFLPGISAAAHFGGGAAGFIVATLLHVQRFAPQPRKTAALLLVALLPVLCWAGVVELMAQDPRWQRLKDAIAVQKRQEAHRNFRNHIIPAIDRADGAADAALQDGMVLSDKPPDKRSEAHVGRARANLKEARAAVQEALDKLREKPRDDERLEMVWLAAKDHLQAAAELLARADEVLEQKSTWGKDERTALVLKRLRTQINWRAARNAL